MLLSLPFGHVLYIGANYVAANRLQRYYEGGEYFLILWNYAVIYSPPDCLQRRKRDQAA